MYIAIVISTVAIVISTVEYHRIKHLIFLHSFTNFENTTDV